MIWWIGRLLLIASYGVFLWWAWLQPEVVTLNWGDYYVSTTPFSVALVSSLLLFTLLLARYSIGRLISWVHGLLFNAEEVLTRALTLSELEEEERAEKLWSKGILRRSFVHRLAAYERGKALLAQKKTNEALFIFQKLSEDQRSFLLGLRGLVKVYQQQQSWQVILSLMQAHKRAILAHPWFVQYYYESAKKVVDLKAWDEALVAMLQNNKIDRATYQVEKASIRYHQALQTSDEQQKQKLLDQALHWNPCHMPILEVAIQQDLSHHQLKKAVHRIEQAWKIAPNETLAGLYRKTAVLQTPLDTYRHFQRLAGFNKDHPISLLILAECALEAKLWGEARHYLESLHSHHQSPRLYALYAQLEEQEYNNTQEAMRWLKEGIAYAEKGNGQACDSNPPSRTG